MSWGIMRAFVAILFVSHVSGMTPSSWVTREQLADHQQPALETWDQTVKTLIGGKGSLIPRTAQVNAALQQARSRNVTPDVKVKEVRRMLDWRELDIIQGKSLWDERAISDGRIVQWKLNAFPYQLPDDVTHWLFWFRTEFLSASSFMENGRHAFSQEPEVLMRYILDYDFFGAYGISTELDRGFRRLEFQHPTNGDIWVDPYTRTQVNHQVGVKAMRCAGKRINEIFQRKFPADEYEVIWNRSPERYKSVVSPDHFHVFVKPREPYTEQHVYP